MIKRKLQLGKFYKVNYDVPTGHKGVSDTDESSVSRTSFLSYGIPLSKDVARQPPHLLTAESPYGKSDGKESYYGKRAGITKRNEETSSGFV